MYNMRNRLRNVVKLLNEEMIGASMLGQGFRIGQERESISLCKQRWSCPALEHVHMR